MERNYAVIDSENGLVDVYSTMERASYRARCIAGVDKPTDAREFNKPGAVRAFRNYRDTNAENPIWIEATEAAVTDADPMNTPREYSLAVLMAEDETGIRVPLAIVATRAEADEILVGDMERRLSALDAGDDPGICPCEYQIWEHRCDGYVIAERWPA